MSESPEAAPAVMGGGDATSTPTKKQWVNFDASGENGEDGTSTQPPPTSPTSTPMDSGLTETSEAEAERLQALADKAAAARETRESAEAEAAADVAEGGAVLDSSAIDQVDVVVVTPSTTPAKLQPPPSKGAVLSGAVGGDSPKPVAPVRTASAGVGGASPKKAAAPGGGATSIAEAVAGLQMDNVPLEAGGAAQPSQPPLYPDHYENGQLIVTLNPVNQKCPWLTPATFDPEYIPPELMAPKLTLTADEMNMTMDFLMNDCRFGCYTVCYRRIIVAWLVVGFLVLLGLLFSGEKGITLFGIGVCWLIVNACGIVMCLYIKAKMNRDLEVAVSSVNRILAKHKILVGLEDQGRISCHKICLHFIYYDYKECLAWVVGQLEEQENREKRRRARAKDPGPAKKQENGSTTGAASAASGEGVNGGGQTSQPDDAVEVHVEDTEDIIAQDEGDNLNTAHIRRLERAEHLLVRHSQLFVKDLCRELLTLRLDVPEGLEAHRPRHSPQQYCLCQFVEQNYFRMKPRKWYAIFS